VTDEMNTQEKILHFGKQDFLQNGFKNASLRNIAAAAGMTTGAIYAYFKNKNALFEAIVEPVCKQVEEMFGTLSTAYYNADGIVGEITAQNSLHDLHEVYKFIYKHFDVFRLLVAGAEGSSKEDFVHTIVDYEIEHTLAYLDRLKKGKKVKVELSHSMIHTISESCINAIFEPVRHNMSYEQATQNIDFLCVFYTGGWKSLFNEMFHEPSP